MFESQLHIGKNERLQCTWSYLTLAACTRSLLKDMQYIIRDIAESINLAVMQVEEGLNTTQLSMLVLLSRLVYGVWCMDSQIFITISKV